MRKRQSASTMKGGKAVEFLLSLRVYLSVIFLLVPSTFSSPVEKPESPVNYGILVDAGSTSTKINIYSWSPSISYASVPRISLLSNEKVKPGLSRYDYDPKGLTSYMADIMAIARKQVPAAKHSETPIYVMATAGLRFLSAKDAYHLVEATKMVLANKTLNPFSYTPSSVSILSGEEEGVYSWISANYLLGFFDSYRPTNESVGVLEMGGGSTQITFIPHGPLFSEEFQVTVAGREYQLYVQSYLQYGATAIKLQVAHVLAERYQGKDDVENPCMLRGDTSRTRLETGRWLTEKGSGSPEMCVQLLQDIVRPYTGINCQPKPCAIGGVYQPSLANITFYATQAYSHTPSSLKVIGPDDILHIDKLEEAAFKHCNRSLHQAVNEFGFNELYASSDCLMGLYIPTLLTLSYGFSRNTTEIKLTSKIGEERIDWSLGAMLIKLSASDKASYSVNCKTLGAGDKDSKLGQIKGHNTGNTIPKRTLGVVLISLLLSVILQGL